MAIHNKSHYNHALMSLNKMRKDNVSKCNKLFEISDNKCPMVSYTIDYNNGTLNRLDRLTAANYGMPINTNLCENKFVACNGLNIMLQAASLYTQGNGEYWKINDMVDIMLDISRTSLRMIGKDIFKQLTK